MQDTAVGRGAVPETLAALWEEQREVITRRVQTLEELAVAALGGDVSGDVLGRAVDAAHKLAGVSGTFGFARASRIARELDEALSKVQDGDGRVDPLWLSERIAELRRDLRPSVPGRPSPAPRSAVEPAPMPSDPDHGPAGGNRILAVMADRAAAARMADEAVARGLFFHAVAGAVEAHRAVARWKPDAVVADVEEIGSGDLTRLHAEVPDAIMIALAGHHVTVERRLELARAGVDRLIDRCASPRRIVRDVGDLLEQERRVAGTVLAASPDPEVAARLRTAAGDGLQIVAARSVDELWTALEERTPDAVLIDGHAWAGRAAELCRAIRMEARHADLPLWVLGAPDGDRSADEDAGAGRWIERDADPRRLTLALRARLRRARAERLRAGSDPLTGLLTRTAARIALERLLAAAERYEQPLAVAAIDVDGLGTVDRDRGHRAGDSVLTTLGDLLQRSVRTEDVVGRWAGDRFVLGFYGMDRSDALQRVRATLDRIAALRFEGRGGSFEVTCSSGIAGYPADGRTVAALLDAAAEGLRAAKAAGGNDVRARSDIEARAVAADVVDVAVVEDDEVLQALLTHALTTQGLTCRSFADGVEAAEALGGVAPRVRARGVLLDVQLPGLDGHAILRRWAEDGVLHRTKVIMLTARAGEAEVLRAMDLGAFDHISKPFSIPVLMHRVRRALSER